MTAGAGTRARRQPAWSLRAGDGGRLDDVRLAVRPASAAAPAAVATCSDLGEVSWIDVAEATVRASTPVGLDVATDVALHPQREVVAVSGMLGHALWSVGSAPARHTGAWGGAVAYSPGGRLAVAAGRHVVVHEDGAEPAAPPTYVSAPAPSTVTGLAWTPRIERVAASSYGGVHVYDGVGPEPVRVHPYAGSHLAVAVNPSGRWICSGNQDASVHIWRTADNDELEMAGYPDKVTRLAFDDTGRWFANNGAPEVTVWDFLGKGPRGRAPHLLAGHTRVVDLAWRPGTGAVLASVGEEGGVRVWSMAGAGAAGRKEPPRRHPILTLPVDDALAARWLGADALVVARRSGVVELWPVAP